MTLQMILGVVAGGLAIIAIAALAFAYSKTNYAKTTIELQNSNIKALSDRQKIQEDEIKSLQKKNVIIQTELDAFKSVPLVQIAEGQTQLASLAGIIAENQKLIMQHLKII